MRQDFDFLLFEQELYEAALIPERWPVVLEKLGQISGSAGAGLLCVGENGVQVTTAPVLGHAFDRFVTENWDARNSRRKAVIASGLVNAPRFINEYDYLPSLEEWKTDPMINEVFRPEGLGWASGFIVDLPHGDLLILNLEQYWDRGPIRGEALSRLDAVFPHLVRAGTLAARVAFDRVRTAIETLSAIGLPAAALTAAGRVVLANEGFETARQIWTTRGGDRLVLHDSVADGLLAHAIASLGSSEGPRSIPLRAVRGGLVTAVLQVVPVRRAAHDVFSGASAIVILSQPKEGDEPAKLIQSLFDLTPAELGVAQSVAAGRTVMQIARASGRSVNTVRNQLKSAMSKTGSTRQIELVMLMNQLRGRQ